MTYRKIHQCLFAFSLFAATAISTTAQADYFYDHIPDPRLQNYSPWFTGPLLAPSGHVIPPGHVNIEPYIYATVISGTYNNHWHYDSQPNFYKTYMQIPIQIGLVSHLDFQIVPQAFYNETQGAHTINVGDLPASFDIQLWLDRATTWWPAMKINVGVNIPTGKYQKLHSNKKGTDAIGAGSWLPEVALVFSKLYHFKTVHFMNTRLAFSYTVGTPVHVKRLNSYGGGDGTHGRVFPGNVLNIDGAFEYSITQRWGVALDAVYTHSNKTRFSGNPGTTSTGPATVGSPSSEQFSLAPGIEYNWSANVGLIGGVWFTLGGRNSQQFTTGILALNIYI